VAAVVAIAVVAGTLLPPVAMRWAVAAILAGFAAQRVLRGQRHPAFGGMRVTRTDLVIWSFLMASAHGAGLMVLPFVMGASGAGDGAGSALAGTLAADAHAGHVHHAAEALQAGVFAGQAAGLLAAAVHTLSYLLVAGLIAFVVQQKFGVRILRTAWINLDIIWVGVLLVTAAVIIRPVL
jgi:hypothetical protein